MFVLLLLLSLSFFYLHALKYFYNNNLQFGCVCNNFELFLNLMLIIQKTSPCVIKISK